MHNNPPKKHRYPFVAILILSLTLLLIVGLFYIIVLKNPTNVSMSDRAPTYTFVTARPNPTPYQVISTDTEYSDENIQIAVTKVVKTDLVYYVADIEISDVQYFKNSFANDVFAYHNYEAVSSQAERNNAILAINSDDCAYNESKLTIRDGVLYQDNFSDEVLVLMDTGEMRIVEDVPGEDLIEQGVIHSWSFGPTLVLDGQYVERYSKVARANPRTGVGMIEPLHYIFIVVDGRQPGHSLGLEMEDFAQLFLEYGCTVAYNFDGGGSSEMVMNGQIVNSPSGGVERKQTDIVYIGLE